MALSKIKEEFRGKRIAFGDSGAPIGTREDIDQLAIIAHQSGDSNLLRLFKEPMPSLAELKKAITDNELREIKKVVPQKEVEKIPAAGDKGNNPLNKTTKEHKPKRAKKQK